VAKLSSIFNSKKIPDTGIIVIFIFFVLELLTRVVFRPQYIAEEFYAKYSPHYDYGFDEQMPIFYEEDGKLILYSTSYLEFWKQSMPRKKMPGKQRIFTIGSSVSRGDFQANYSYYLEQYLNEDQDGKYEVVNCSATGIGSSRILLIFKKILKYEPDMVIFHLHGSNEFEDQRDLAEATRLKSSYEGIIRQSRFFCVFKKMIDEQILNAVKPKETIDAETYERWFVAGKRDEWYNTLCANTAEIVQIAKEKSVPIVFVNRVYRSDSLAGYEDEESLKFNAIAKKFTQQHVNLIDTPELFTSYFGDQAEKEAIFLDTVHLKPIGHQVIARKLTEIIKENHKLTSSTIGVASTTYSSR